MVNRLKIEDGGMQSPHELTLGQHMPKMGKENNTMGQQTQWVNQP